MGRFRLRWPRSAVAVTPRGAGWFLTPVVASDRVGGGTEVAPRTSAGDPHNKVVRIPCKAATRTGPMEDGFCVPCAGVCMPARCRKMVHRAGCVSMQHVRMWKRSENVCNVVYRELAKQLQQPAAAVHGASMAVRAAKWRQKSGQYAANMRGPAASGAPAEQMCGLCAKLQPMWCSSHFSLWSSMWRGRKRKLVLCVLCKLEMFDCMACACERVRMCAARP